MSDNKQKTAAELCRERGWVPGDVLRTVDGSGLQITAVGMNTVLSRNIHGDENSVWYGRESECFYDLYEWKKIDVAPLDSTPPKEEWFR